MFPYDTIYKNLTANCYEKIKQGLINAYRELLKTTIEEDFDKIAVLLMITIDNRVICVNYGQSKAILINTINPQSNDNFNAYEISAPIDNKRKSLEPIVKEVKGNSNLKFDMVSHLIQRRKFSNLMIKSDLAAFCYSSKIIS